EIEPGDQFLICSDGLHQYLIEDEIVTVFSQERGSNIVPRLIKCANARGGKDNITAVVIEMEDPNAHLPSTQLDVNTELLAQCPLLNELGFTQAMQLIPLGQIRTFLKDEVLQAEEEPHIGLVLVLSGRISFFRRGVFFDSIGSGSHFGESSLFGQLYASESAICEEETRVMVFPVSALRRYLHENTEFSNNLMWQIAKHQARKVRNYIGRLSQLLP
ncbi:MAG: cyclic nucleotide-binding domain-containing protein, partial [Myxococcota bacterium]